MLTKEQTSPVENLKEMYNEDLLDTLKKFDPNKTSIKAQRRAYEYIQRPCLEVSYLAKKSKVAADLCQWLISVITHLRQVRLDQR